MLRGVNLSPCSGMIVGMSLVLAIAFDQEEVVWFMYLVF
jgi:hypothetical protein